MADVFGSLLPLIVSAAAQERFGLQPFDAKRNKPQDIGLGGPSTEYLATEYDQEGKVMNYPQIWWDKQGDPLLLDPDAAYNMALSYERLTPNAFPRFPSIGAAETMAQNRSAMGGGEIGPLARMFGQK